jgi:nitrate/nitrite transporter NarK
MCYYPFTFILADILSDRYSLDSDQVGQVMSIPNFFALSAPLAGIAMDKIGQRPLLLIFCYILLISAYVIWLCLPVCTTPCQFATSVPIAIQGVFLGFFSSIIFSSIPLVTKTQYLGTAYGLVSSTKALGKNSKNFKMKKMKKIVLLEKTIN